jgi:small-conductance mechanosensitive channel
MADVLTAFLAFVPRIFGAAALLVLGILTAVVARWLVPLLLRRLRFDDLCQRAGVTNLLERGGITRRPSQLLGLVIAYAILGYAILTALGAVGLTFLAGSLNELILYAPRALTAVFLVILGVAAAGLLAEAVGRLLADTGIGDVDTLRNVVRFGLIFVVAILAAALLGIDVALLIAITVIALSGLALTAALAVGLGLRGLSQNIVASRYIAEGIAEGDRITINGTSGTVEQVGHAMTTLRADDGRAFLVPNHHFLDHVVEKVAPRE